MKTKPGELVANLIVKTLAEKGLTLALAESVTCGMAAHRLAAYNGTSNVLEASVVCYTPEAKQQLLGVSARRIKKYTCESMEITGDLVNGLSKMMKADIYAAITGLAAPGGSESKEKPVGTVFFSVLFMEKKYEEKKMFRGTPLQIRTKACEEIYRIILRMVAEVG